VRGGINIKKLIKNKPNIGLGLRYHYLDEILENPPAEIDFFEIHPENYMSRGGEAVAQFKEIAKSYPILTHGLSLSLGSVSDLDWDYLKTLKTFLHEHSIPWHTDHLCFTSVGGQQFHDLLPLPFTKEAVKHVSERARIVQDYLEIPFAIENISFYLYPAKPEMTELQFIQEVLHQSGVSLLLDINNVYVNSLNHGTDAKHTVNALSEFPIKHIHMAGHDKRIDEKTNETLIVDTHGADITNGVWELLSFLKTKIDVPPVLIERDNNFPEVNDLLNQVRKAKEIVT